MRKLIVYMATSLDGYIADNKGSYDWLAENLRELDLTAFHASVDTVLLGRVTHDQIVNEIERQHHPYPNVQSYVFTRSERENTERITYTHASVCDVVRELKTQEGKDIWLLGGTALVGQLQRENLIDEYHITTLPGLLGDGVPLFSKQKEAKQLGLNEVIVRGSKVITKYCVK